MVSSLANQATAVFVRYLPEDIDALSLADQTELKQLESYSFPPDLAAKIFEDIIKQGKDFRLLPYFPNHYLSHIPPIRSLLRGKPEKIVEIANSMLQALPSLKSLDLSGTEMSRLHELRRTEQNQIEELDLQNCLNVPEGEIALIRERFPRLKRLDLSRTKMTRLKAKKAASSFSSATSSLLFKSLNFLHQGAEDLLGYFLSFSIPYPKEEPSEEPPSIEEFTFPIEELILKECNSLSAQELGSINTIFPNLRKLNLADTQIDCLEGLNLPKLEELSLANCRNLPKEEFRKLAKTYPNLKKLNLEWTRIDSLEGLALPELEELNLYRCRDLPKEEFSKLAKMCPNLKKLGLANTKIDSLEGIDLPKLEELNLANCRKVFSELAKRCPNLKRLNLERTQIACLGSLNLPKLEELNLANCHNLPGWEFSKLSKTCPNLKKLNLEWTWIDRLEGLDLPQLEELNLTDCQDLPKEEFSKLARTCPNLKKLNLEQTQIDSVERLHLPQLEELKLNSREKMNGIECNIDLLAQRSPNLSKLDLYQTSLLIEDFYLPKLEELNLVKCTTAINEKFFESLKQKSPNLKKLNLIFNDFSKKDPKIFFSLPNLEELRLEGGHLEITENFFYSLKKNCPTLKRLNLRCNKIESIEGLDFPQLEELDLQNCEFFEGKLPLHQKCPNLRKLSLCDSNIKSLEGLDSPILEELRLSYCKQLPVQEFLQIAKKFSNLKKIDLGGTNIDSLEGLTLSQLRELTIRACEQLSENEILTLAKRCPNLRKIDLSYTQISHVDELNLPNLEELEWFQLFPVSFNGKAFPQLKILRMGGVHAFYGLPFLNLEILEFRNFLSPNQVAKIKKRLPRLKEFLPH
ncbi:leucine-rich repeat domain-containing protein [Candidatus Protochlamydia phocaeensis]|uniref:leucine-rich repeat domain-containing protein n=1 Tax=Candidatus Protochlamydia phocaeensis TaxID=1414722 RepID=UPI000838B655|nr:leucine-rich repeat domain-containing protein [Candidatus Protochlamydia phocaeensis]